MKIHLPLRNRIRLTGKSEDLVTVTAGSLEELEKKIQDMLYDSMSDYVFTPQEKQVGWNVDFRG